MRTSRKSCISSLRIQSGRSTAGVAPAQALPESPMTTALALYSHDTDYYNLFLYVSVKFLFFKLVVMPF